MNPYNEINNLDKLIDDLEHSLQYSRNKPKDTKNLNILINARNSFESMLANKYYTDVIELFIYNSFLTEFRYADIENGGDINQAQDNVLHVLKNALSTGLEGRKELVYEELRLYLDFHALRDGEISIDSAKEDKDLYIKAQDELITNKMNENIKVIKGLIPFNLKNI